MKSLSSLALLATLAAFSANADTNADEACPLMMGKLSISYEMETLEERVEARKGKHLRHKLSTGERADLLVTRTYGMRRNELEEKWPGFFDLAKEQVEQGITAQLDPKTFREYATRMCLAVYL